MRIPRPRNFVVCLRIFGVTFLRAVARGSSQVPGRPAWAVPVVALIGARQVGKSTLARQLASRVKQATVFDLENGPDLARLDEPTLALGGLRGLVIIDEIQRRPDLFPALRVLADRPRCPARFLVLGSAAPALLRQSSETLAGRIATFELDGFNLGEVAPKKAEQLWLRGGFPKSFLAASDAQSLRWRQEFLGHVPGAGYPSPRVSACRPRRWGVSGACWPIRTGRYGTRPRSDDRWA